ncbi:uncharacterized protein L3040_000636 [Drepanopeziza brunnea f. sp. 'multigermtubi']|uniref:uncharacterized protein n=1 Tax=Drepanopeziza brunnea f. sp. 'multigermtubi' TaxID=698441 RepID=UPI0023A262B8|nr:hypothetical protein L3040_000636 [Drepanopeziza brunnea f. sp. 'multigermtubi']
MQSNHVPINLGDVISSTVVPTSTPFNCGDDNNNTAAFTAAARTQIPAPRQRRSVRQYPPNMYLLLGEADIL